MFKILFYCYGLSEEQLMFKVPISVYHQCELNIQIYCIQFPIRLYILVLIPSSYKYE